jgi:hypothetical protein
VRGDVDDLHGVERASARHAGSRTGPSRGLFERPAGARSRRRRLDHRPGGRGKRNTGLHGRSRASGRRRKGLRRRGARSARLKDRPERLPRPKPPILFGHVSRLRSRRARSRCTGAAAEPAARVPGSSRFRRSSELRAALVRLGGSCMCTARRSCMPSWGYSGQPSSDWHPHVPVPGSRAQWTASPQSASSTQVSFGVRQK